eukprot:maker-scaffold263_size232787-snap-gene-1.20 protein:Tk11201 transcript:maker-scaffold263_size232787-snap-gene-1.20-mRNA-1 annotation:"ubiquitin-protein ligase bre1"
MKQIQAIDIEMASAAIAAPEKDDFESHLDSELEKLDDPTILTKLIHTPADKVEVINGIMDINPSKNGSSVVKAPQEPLTKGETPALPVNKDTRSGKSIPPGDSSEDLPEVLEGNKSTLEECADIPKGVDESEKMPEEPKKGSKGNEEIPKESEEPTKTSVESNEMSVDSKNISVELKHFPEESKEMSEKSKETFEKSKQKSDDLKEISKDSKEKSKNSEKGSEEKSKEISQESKEMSAESRIRHEETPMDEDTKDESLDLKDEDHDDDSPFDPEVESLLKEVSDLVDSDSDSKDETRNIETEPPQNLDDDSRLNEEPSLHSNTDDDTQDSKMDQDTKKVNGDGEDSEGVDDPDCLNDELTNQEPPKADDNAAKTTTTTTTTTANDKEEPPTKEFLDEALQALSGIAQSSRKLLDSDHSVNKRARGSEVEECDGGPQKKAKVDEAHGSDKSSATKSLTKIKKVVKRMSRTDIEDLVTSTMVEVLSGRSEIGKLRQKCDIYDASLEMWKKQAAALEKQCQDLTTVMRKYITEIKNRPQDKINPIKITRSVGLQVVTDKKRIIMNGPPIPTSPKGVGTSPHSVTPRTPSLSRQGSLVTPGVSMNKRTPPVRHPLPQGGHQLNRSILPKTTTPMAAKAPVAPVLRAVPCTSTPMPPLPLPQVPLPQTKPTPASKPGVIDVVDLSDEEDDRAKNQNQLRLVPVNRLQATPTSNAVNGGNRTYPPQVGVQSLLSAAQANSRLVVRQVKHPAPLPTSTSTVITGPGMKASPPKPSLKISKLKTGIVLSWNMARSQAFSDVTFYQIYAYQEGATPPSVSLWKKVGDVKALPLPMACTLTQFQKGHKYHFAVRAMDIHKRVGIFSDPQSIQLT